MYDEHEQCALEFAFHTVLEILCFSTNQITLMPSLHPAFSFLPCASHNVATAHALPPAKDCPIFTAHLSSGLSADEQCISSQAWAKATLYETAVVGSLLPSLMRNT